MTSKQLANYISYILFAPTCDDKNDDWYKTYTFQEISQLIENQDFGNLSSSEKRSLLAVNEELDKRFREDGKPLSFYDLLWNLFRYANLDSDTTKRISEIMASRIVARESWNEADGYFIEDPKFDILDTDQIYLTGKSERKTNSRIRNDSLDSILRDAERRGDKDDNTSNIQKILDSPASIYEYLDERVYKQDKAKKAASLFLWNHVNGHKRVLLFAGPTGCGKTEIIRHLQELYPRIMVANGASMNADGYKSGIHPIDLMAKYKSNGWEDGILVIDEADKMLVVGEAASNPGAAYELQANLLKIMEGDIYTGFDEDKTSYSVDTSKLGIILMGSFDQMLKNKGFAGRGIGYSAAVKTKDEAKYEDRITPEDLVNHANMRREMAGRIDDIVQLHPLTAKDYVKIAHKEKMSPISKLEQEYNCKINISEEKLEEMAQEAEKSKMGVRFMKGRIMEALDSAMFEHPNENEYTI